MNTSQPISQLKLPLASHDAPLQASIVAWMIDRIASGDITPFLEAGVAPSALDDVRRISARLQSRLLAIRRPFVSIEIDFSVLEGTLTSLQQADDYRDVVAYFIIHGATNPMLRHLFGLSRTEIAQSRMVLLSSDLKGGRTTLPDHDVRMSIWEECELLKRNGMTDQRDRYKTLHEVFDGKYNLATLYAIVNEFEGLAP
jgi:hypothetical protein